MSSLTPAQARRIDELAWQEYHIPGLVLMENAGRGCAEWLLQQANCRSVTIVAGKGNNAGDGFVIARHLHNHGVRVQLLLLTDPTEFTGDALINWRIVQALQMPLALWRTEAPPECLAEWLEQSDWVVDAILGTGLSGTVREPYATAIQELNQRRSHARWRLLAIDLPSGLDGLTGEKLGCCVQADHTATFVAPKQGLLLGAGPGVTGQVHVITIGSPPQLLARVLAE